MLRSDIHCFVAAGAVGEDDCKTVGAVRLVTFQSPSDHVGIIEIIVLSAKYMRGAKIHHEVDLALESGTVHCLNAVIVAVEHAGISLGP